MRQQVQEARPVKIGSHDDADASRYKLLKHIGRQKRVTKKILKQLEVIKLYDLEHAYHEPAVVDGLIGLQDIHMVISVRENQRDCPSRGC